MTIELHKLPQIGRFKGKQYWYVKVFIYGKVDLSFSTIFPSLKEAQRYLSKNVGGFAFSDAMKEYEKRQPLPKSSPADKRTLEKIDEELDFLRG